MNAAQLDAAIHAQAYHDYLVETGVDADEAVKCALTYMKAYGEDEFLFRRGIIQEHPGDSERFKPENWAKTHGRES